MDSNHTNYPSIPFKGSNPSNLWYFQPNPLFMSRSPEIGVSDTEAAITSTDKPAADSIAMPPVDDDALEIAYDTAILECQRVAVRAARASRESGGWRALFQPLPLTRRERAWTWKLACAQRQLNNLNTIENLE